GRNQADVGEDGRGQKEGKEGEQGNSRSHDWSIQRDWKSGGIEGEWKRNTGREWSAGRMGRAVVNGTGSESGATGFLDFLVSVSPSAGGCASRSAASNALRSPARSPLAGRSLFCPPRGRTWKGFPSRSFAPHPRARRSRSAERCSSASGKG